MRAIFPLNNCSTFLKQTKNEILSLCDLLIEFCGSAKPFEELLCLKHLLSKLGSVVWYPFSRGQRLFAFYLFANRMIVYILFEKLQTETLRIKSLLLRVVLVVQSLFAGFSDLDLVWTTLLEFWLMEFLVGMEQKSILLW